MRSGQGTFFDYEVSRIESGECNEGITSRQENIT
jgi:hypothetical protein